MYTLHVNLPNRPQGSRVYIPGLGTYNNGSTNELEEFVVTNAFSRYPRLRKAVEGTDIVVGTTPLKLLEVEEPVETYISIEETE